MNGINSSTAPAGSAHASGHNGAGDAWTGQSDLEGTAEPLAIKRTQPVDPRGRAHGEPGWDPFDNPAAEAARQEQAKVQAVTEDRKNRWKPHWFALASVDGLPHQWARNLTWKFERQDASRDPVTDAPTLMFCGVDAVEAGASDEILAALPKLKPADMTALKVRAAAIRQDFRKQVDSMARSMTTGREAAVAIPEPMGLDALLAEEDEDAAYRIGEVWPTGGRVLLAAQYKSGKSTLVGNLVRSLVDGDAFLGRFEVQPVGKVVLIDTELDKRTLRRWLRDQGIHNTTAVTVVSLRGAVSAFDILDAAARSQWAQRFSGADVVILDCLRPVIDALNLSEDKDAGKLLVAFDALLAEAGAEEGMVVTHMGHHNERARGDSRLLDWPDVLLKIVRGGDEADEVGRPRFLSAMGRDVELPEGQLAFDRDTRHLTYAGGSRTESRAADLIDKRLAAVLDVLADARAEGKDGMNTTAIKDAVGGKKDAVVKALAAAKERQLVTVEFVGRAHIYRLAPKALDPMYLGEKPNADTAPGLAPALEFRPPQGQGPTAG